MEIWDCIQDEITRHFHRNLYGRNYPCGIFLQSHSVLHYLGGYNHGTIRKEKGRS